MMVRNTCIILSLALAGCTVITTSGTPASPATQASAVSPVITGLTASPTSISQPGQVISIQVAAYDPRGQNLRYTWTATGGTLSSTTGTLISWKSPTTAGSYTLSVLVANDAGGTAVGSINIVVSSDGTGTINVQMPTSGSGNTNSGTSNGDTTVVSEVNPGFRFYDCSFVTFTSGWVVGGSGRIAHTTDAGSTWIRQDIPGVSGPLTSAYFLPSANGNVGWVGGGSTLYKTTNAGATWTPQSIGIMPVDGRGPYLNGLFFKDASVGYAALSAAVGYSELAGLFKTTDGGVTWERVVPNNVMWLSGTADGTLFYGTQLRDKYNTTGSMKRYANGGTSSVYDYSAQFISASPYTPSVLFASVMGSLITSKTGGSTWTNVAYSPDNQSVWWGLAAISDTEALAIREDRNGYAFRLNIVETTDGGKTWVTRSTLEEDDSFRRDYKEGTYPRMFAFDRRHAWQAFTDDTALLRIGAP